LVSERWLRHLATAQIVATGDNVIGRGLPLVVVSQGSDGSFAGHYDTALALAEVGFVVAAARSVAQRPPSR
jgi:predicted dienelactone hydrolase